MAMVWWGRRSDRAAERRYHAAIPLFVASGGLALATLFDDPSLKMLAFCIAGFGIFACLPVFWTLPTAFLSGADLVLHGEDVVERRVLALGPQLRTGLGFDELGYSAETGTS